jgi:PAS domain S-box-containing protein
VALVSGALLVSGLVDLYFSYRENKAALVRLQREMAEAGASRMDQFVRAIEDQIGWTTQVLSRQQGSSLERRSFDDLLREAPSITEASYLDAAGREQLRISRLGMDVVGSQMDYSTEPKFLEAKSGKTFFGPVYFREGSEPYLTIAMSGKGQDAGVTVAEVNLKFIRDVVSQIKVGKAGHAYVLDSRGDLIAHPDMNLVLKKTSFASLPQVRDAMTGSPKPGDARDEATIARNLQGRQVLTASATIIPLGWLVFVEQPLAEAFAPLYSSMIRTGILLLVGLGVSVMASVLLARKMVNPIQALQARAARIGAGALDERIEIRTGDELEALANQFNSMAEQLRDSYANLEQRMEALRESEQKYRNIIENAVEGIFQATADGRYLSVNSAFARMCGFTSPEQMIGAITDIAHQLYVDPEDRMRIRRLYDDPGFVKGFEAQFRRKDGGLIWVSITARSVRDESGVLLYYEGTIQDITERKRAELEVQSHREQLRLLATELSVTEERERRRLATDLHDSIGQTLAMCKLKLSELRSQAPSNVLADDCDYISTLLDQAIQGTRSLTFELSPPVLYELGLEAALESLVERMQQVNGIPINFSGDGGSKPLSEDTAVLCFRAVQELLVNVVKHARAQKIEVSTGRDRGRIRVTVADDGIGFDTSESVSRKGGKRGFGLFSIKERLQHLGGSLKVDSKPGQGTRVTLSAPLKRRPTRKG